jgi:4-amino-4-deoxy-L-arabinose transferase-like glycosyltransferase
MWWIGPLVLVLIRVAVGQARVSNAARNSHSVVFGIAPLYKWLGVFVLAAFAVLFVRDFRGEETWVLVLAALLIAFICFSWPATFICSENSIIKHVWWRRSVVIPWRDVVQLEETKGCDLNVYGAGGVCMCFTRFHVAPHRFKADVLKRAELKGVILSSAPTSLR